MTFRFLLTNEFILLLVPLAFFLLVAVARAVVREDLPMSKVWLTIKVALFGLFLGFLVHPFKVPVEYTPYFLEIHGLILLFCWANLSAYLLVDLLPPLPDEGGGPHLHPGAFPAGDLIFFGATALRVIFESACILVAHPPPWGTLDEVLGKFHAGCRGLEEIVWKRQPRMLICGHIHERPGTARLGKTLVVNCNMGRKRAGAMIDWKESREPHVHML